jgi:hypothetical protein
MNTHYVYEHWRTDKNVCFYVGKGKGKRAFDMKYMRNRHHTAIVSKLTSLGLVVHVKIIAENLTNEEAIRLEKERIAFYGVGVLSNMTEGGEGMANPTPETRLKMSMSQKARFERPEEREKVSQRSRNRKVGDSTRAKLSAAGKGRRMSDETREKMRIAAQKRGVSEATRNAQRAAVTGKKRAPFTEETLRRMSEAAKLREAKRREA